MADPQGSTADDAVTESPEEATKRKFREALERKSAHVNGGAAARDSAKVRGAQSAVGGKRTFRRKAGG
ncbi:DUF5302 domain-containing protein [Nocardia neocaledoniensis]|uniref:DUF5302 domain-containing protein n=1 Tax=Nocardia neocaledoniensis TaxID=236511 RepID=UPI002457E1F0|nr:DUF5302 domain-containing protein [Nocardia neocaledoniensis]